MAGAGYVGSGGLHMHCYGKAVCRTTSSSHSWIGTNAYDDTPKAPVYGSFSGNFYLDCSYGYQDQGGCEGLEIDL